MAKKDAAYTVGVEEELFLVDLDTRGVVSDIPKKLIDDFNAIFPQQLVREFLSSQVEIISKPCASIQELQHELSMLRTTLNNLAKAYNLSPVSVSTHPLSQWHEQSPSPSERYQRLAQALKISARRMSVCGMHVHIGIESPQQRLHAYNAIRWYLPHLLALSTSSPFWGAEDTGHMSYRTSVIGGLPRSGTPPYFPTLKDYQAYIQSLTDCALIQDASEIWWDCRMSCRYPTVEMRVTDACTSLQDTIGLAALYMCLIEYVLTHPQSKPTPYLEKFMQENRWAAQRYSMENCEFISMDGLTRQAFIPLMEALLVELKPISETLGCEEGLSHVHTILQQGTSADRQRNAYLNAIKSDAPESALQKIIDMSIAETNQPLNEQSSGLRAKRYSR